MYVCIYISIYLYIYIYIYMCIVLETLRDSNVRARRAPKGQWFTSKPISSSISIYLYVYIYKYIYIYVCICICIYIWYVLETLRDSKARARRAPEGAEWGTSKPISLSISLYLYVHMYIYMRIFIYIYMVRFGNSARLKRPSQASTWRGEVRWT